MLWLLLLTTVAINQSPVLRCSWRGCLALMWLSTCLPGPPHAPLNTLCCWLPCSTNCSATQHITSGYFHSRNLKSSQLIEDLHALSTHCALETSGITWFCTARYTPTLAMQARCDQASPLTISRSVTVFLSVCSGTAAELASSLSAAVCVVTAGLTRIDPASNPASRHLVCRAPAAPAVARVW